MPEHIPHPRTYTAQEIADLGDALSPHIDLAVQKAVAPLVQRFDSLDRRASIAGILGGALPGILAFFAAMFRAK